MKSVFVGNMSFQTTESDLRELFRPFGEVTRVHIVTDRETGRARGFAFVEMPNDQEAANAIANLNGKQVNDRGLKVSEARPRTERKGPEMGGGRTHPEFSGEGFGDAAVRQRREPRW